MLPTHPAHPPPNPPPLEYATTWHCTWQAYMVTCGPHGIIGLLHNIQADQPQASLWRADQCFGTRDNRTFPDKLPAYKWLCRTHARWFKKHT